MPINTICCFSILVFSLIATTQLSNGATVPKRKASKERLDDFHLGAQYLATQNKAKNKEHTEAGLQGSRMAQRELEQSLSEAKYGKAAKAAFHVAQRPCCGATQNILYDVVDNCQILKHNKIGQKLLPHPKTIEQVDDALSRKLEGSRKTERDRAAQRAKLLAFSSHHSG